MKYAHKTATSPGICDRDFREGNPIVTVVPDDRADWFKPAGRSRHLKCHEKECEIF